MAKEQVNKLCQECRNWKVFGKDCFFFWDRKKECSNHTLGDNGHPKFKKVEFND